MKILLTLTLLGGIAVSSVQLSAQVSTTAPTPLPAAAAANPIVWSATQIYTRQSGYILASAEEMPAAKYSYHPTPEQWTFAKIISHVAGSNGGVCSILSDTPAPATTKVPETASKEELIAALKASFDYCGPVLANLKDSRLSDTITFFGHAQAPRARALIELTDDLEDHYTQLAGYIRLNGMLPPSAQPKPAAPQAPKK